MRFSVREGEERKGYLRSFGKVRDIEGRVGGKGVGGWKGISGGVGFWRRWERSRSRGEVEVFV